MAKSTCLAYLLWLIGGWFGLHHFYLKRDRQAFVWIATWGGLGGVGWFRDLWRIPEYVSDANDDPDFIEDLTHKMRRNKTPPFNIVRFSGQLIMGWTFGYLLKYALPTEFIEEWQCTAEWIGYFGVAVGVHMVGNIGREQCSFKVAWMAAQFTMVLLLFGKPVKDRDYIAHAAIISALIVHSYGKDWRRVPENMGTCKRMGRFSVWVTIYLTLWGSTLYFNATITTKYGEEVKLRDAIHNFFKSPMWAETKQTMQQLYDYCKHHGFWKVWDEIKAALDPEGETNAYKVLGLHSDASQEEIKASYKKLARQWHPDKVKDPAKKRDASDKFMEIQQAYELLSNIKNRRTRQSHRD